MNEVLFAANGILTIPGDEDNWTGKMVTGTHNRRENIQAEKIEYFTGPVGKIFRNKQRAMRLIKTMRRYKGRRVRGVVHSNGADMVMDAMGIEPFRIDVLHMISPAISADCEKNGLNDAIRNNHIGRVYIWCGDKDWALRFGRSILGQLWGYGALGLEGPQPPSDKIIVRREPEFGHSTWFNKENIESTISRVIAEGDRW